MARASFTLPRKREKCRRQPQSVPQPHVATKKMQVSHNAVRAAGMRRAAQKGRARPSAYASMAMRTVKYSMRRAAQRCHDEYTLTDGWNDYLLIEY